MRREDHPRRARRFLRDDRGGIAVMSAILLPALVGGMALGAETGFWYLSQRKLQHAADLAVYAAAAQLRSGRDAQAMEAAALAVAGESGAKNGDAVTLAWPPLNGVFAGEAEAAEVTILRAQRRFISRIYSNDDVPIGARAVAAVQGGGDACLLSLDPTAGGAITVSGSSIVTFVGCDVATNSNADDAFLMSGGAVQMTAGCVHSVGGAVTTGNLLLTACAAPRVEAPVIPDPYADVPEPEIAGSCASGGVGQNNQSVTVTPTETHPLGIPLRRYCGGLDLKGNVHFQPGLYIVDGGNFRINASAQVSGTGVTFLLTNGAEMAFNGNATITLAAPTNGPLSGLLFFGDREDFGADHTINGTAASQLSGAIYTPASTVSYSGNFSGANGCTQVVTWRITFIGNSSLSVDCSAEGVRRIPVAERIALVE